MAMGRFLPIVAVLAIAGSLAAKPKLAPSAGTLPTDGGLFIGLLVGVILILGGLQFFPALALGPIVEHFQVLAAVAQPSLIAKAIHDFDRYPRRGGPAQGQRPGRRPLRRRSWPARPRTPSSSWTRAS
jgi:hypothetical protein